MPIKPLYFNLKTEACRQKIEKSHNRTSLSQTDSFFLENVFFISHNKKYATHITKNKIFRYETKAYRQKINNFTFKRQNLKTKKILYLQVLNQPISHPRLELNFCDHGCAIPKWPPTKPSRPHQNSLNI